MQESAGISDPVGTGETRIVTARQADRARVMEFRLPASAEGGLQIQLRGPLVGAQVSLRDPEGRVRVTPAEVRYTRAQELNNPEHGDLAVLPRISCLASGTWQIVVVDQPAAGLTYAAVTVAPRYRIAMHLTGRVFHVNQPVFVQVQARQFGVPTETQPDSIEVRHLGSDQVTEVALRPQQEVTGIAGADPGTAPLMGAWRPQRQGKHELRAALRDAGEPVAETVRRVEVQQAPIRLVSVGQANHQPPVTLPMEVEVRTAGHYTFSVTYQAEDGSQHLATGNWTLERGARRLALGLDHRVKSVRRLDISWLTKERLLLVVREARLP